ncbi:DNA topoisomerase [Gongronella butleri]|nr:DNA topoisomerase [Gongronella butleri]
MHNCQQFFASSFPFSSHTGQFLLFYTMAPKKKIPPGDSSHPSKKFKPGSHAANPQQAESSTTAMQQSASHEAMEQDDDFVPDDGSDDSDFIPEQPSGKGKAPLKKKAPQKKKAPKKKVTKGKSLGVVFKPGATGQPADDPGDSDHSGDDNGGESPDINQDATPEPLDNATPEPLDISLLPAQQLAFQNNPTFYLGSLHRQEMPQWVTQGSKIALETNLVIPAWKVIINALLDDAAIARGITRIDVTFIDGLIMLSHDAQQDTQDPMAKYGKLPEITVDDKPWISADGSNFGALLANLSSSMFSVDIVQSGVQYSQVFQNRMTVISDVQQENTDRADNTTIAFNLDLMMFQNVHPPLPTELVGTEADNRLYSDFTAFMHKRMMDYNVVFPHLTLIFNGDSLPAEDFELYCQRYVDDVNDIVYDAECSEHFQVAFALSSKFQQTSLVNSSETMGGGTHVDKVKRLLMAAILLQAKNQSLILSPANVQARMHIFVKIKMANPQYDSQKSMLISAENSLPEYNLHAAFLENVLQKNIIAEVIQDQDEVAHQQEALVQHRASEAGKRVYLANFRDATNAGTINSNSCTLIVTSPSSFHQYKALDTVHVGVYPTNSKMVNVRSDGQRAVSKNKAWSELKKILGLKRGSTAPKLRYGKMKLALGTDDAAYLAIGLIINALDVEFKGVLLSSFVQIEFANGVTAAVNPMRTSDSNRLQLAYKSVDNQRVTEMIACQDPAITGAGNTINVEDFINKYVFPAEARSVKTELPSVMDGFNQQQRRVFWSALGFPQSQSPTVQALCENVTTSGNFTMASSIKLTIVKMAQNYVGSNNINVLTPAGNLGTRHFHGKNAGDPMPMPMSVSDSARLIFKQDDNQLIPNQASSPLFMPVLPMILVNGANNVTKVHEHIPKHNPADIAKNILHLLDNEPMEPMTPWYRGFQSTVHMSGNDYYENGVCNIVPGGVKVTELPLHHSHDTYLKLLEKFRLPNVHSAIPGQFWIKGYDDLSTVDNVDIAVYLDSSVMNVVQPMDDGERLPVFGLEGIDKHCNFVCIAENGRIETFSSALDILQYFYDHRLAMYTSLSPLGTSLDTIKAKWRADIQTFLTHWQQEIGGS